MHATADGHHHGVVVLLQSRRAHVHADIHARAAACNGRHGRWELCDDDEKVPVRVPLVQATRMDVMPDRLLEREDDR